MRVSSKAQVQIRLQRLESRREEVKMVVTMIEGIVMRKVTSPELESYYALEGFATIVFLNEPTSLA